MSNPPTSTGRPAKPMSSRLMTMKFMQRAASSAAAASSLPTRPSSTSSQNPSPYPSKRPNPTSSFTSNSTITSSFSASTPHSELQAIREAQAAEEAKRSQALERQAGHETKWVLSTGGNDVAIGGVVGAGMRKESGRGLWVRRMGYSEIDNADSEEDGDGDGEGYYLPDHYRIPEYSASVANNMMGRRSFGKFNRELEKRSRTAAGQQWSSSSDEAMGSAAEESDDEEEEEEEGAADDSDDPVGANELIRASKKEAAGQRAKAARKAEKQSRKADAAKLAEQRRSKDVNLNRLSSISGGGGTPGKGRAAPNPNVDCYNCGEKGHVRKNCPLNYSGDGGGTSKRKRNQQGGGGGGGDGSSPKRSKMSSSFP